MVFKFVMLAFLFLSCSEPKKETLPLTLLKQKATSPCQNTEAEVHSDSMFVQEFKEQDLRVIALCVSCERNLEIGKKVEIYRKFVDDSGIPVSRRPDWSEFR
jgi:hypothetical protein